MSRGKGYDQRIRPRHRVYGLRWCCSETRIFLLRSCPRPAPIVFGIPSFTNLTVDKKRLGFATAGVRYHRRTGSIYRAQDVPLRSEKTACNPPVGGAPLPRRYSATPSQLSAQSACGVITDLWSLFGRTFFRNPRPAWHILFIRVLPATPRRLWASLMG